MLFSMEDKELEDLREWLQSKRGQWRQISKDSGLGYWWIMKFSQGHIKKPGFSMIKKLKAHISVVA